MVCEAGACREKTVQTVCCEAGYSQYSMGAFRVGLGDAGLSCRTEV